MTTHTQNIVRLIKILARPHKILFIPLIIDDEHWDGIRLYGQGYELFQITPIPEKDKKKFAGADEIESVLGNGLIEEKDEYIIQCILEQILIEP